MKKNILKAFLVLASLAFASSAFAATITTSNSTVIGGGTYSPSAKVTITAFATTNQYAASAHHLSGKRTFGGNNSDPKIYYVEGADAVTAATEDFSGWKTF